ncbi:MAG: hypothetical protein WA125_09445 [Desulfosporosinus sp.]
MPLLTRPSNPSFPAVLPQSSPSPPRGCSEPKATDTWNYGFKRLVPLLQSPPFGAGILAMTLFFFIAFFSNVLLAQINLATLGITVTLGTLGILALILLILFLF